MPDSINLDPAPAQAMMKELNLCNAKIKCEMDPNCLSWNRMIQHMVFSMKVNMPQTHAALLLKAYDFPE